MILLSVALTLLFLKNNHIPLHQSSNFIQLLSNNPGSRTILFSITAYTILLYTAGISTVNIFSNAGSVVLFPSDVYSLVIFNDPNISSSTSLSSVVSWLCLSILSVYGFYYSSLYLFCLVLSIISVIILSYYSNKLTICP